MTLDTEQKKTKYLSFVMYILCIVYVFLESKSGKDAVELFLHYYSDVSGSRQARLILGYHMKGPVFRLM